MLENKIRLPYAGFENLLEIPFYVSDEVVGGKLFLLLKNSGYRYLPVSAVYYDPKNANNTFESLYEDALNCCDSIPLGDMYQAYGYDTDEQYQEARATLDSTESPELAEGYYYQESFDNTGIAELGADWIYRMDYDIVRETRLHKGLPVV